MKLPKQSLSEKIFKVFRDRIVYMEYPPEMNLSEKELCKEFGVSRTPLREALRKLEEMKLVTVIPRYGTYVSSIDINEIRCAFEVKIKLEGLAGQVAAKRITTDKMGELKNIIDRICSLSKEDERNKFIELDSQFHEIIYESTQNPILQEFLENLHSRCARLWMASLSEFIPTPEVTQQLKDIYYALEERNAEKALDAMENHVLHFVTQIKNQLL